MTSHLKHVTCIAAILITSGCATLKVGYKKYISGDRPSIYSPVHYMQDDEFKNSAAGALSDPAKAGSPAVRNTILFQGVSIINKNYSAYVDYMTTNRASFLTYSESLALGATTAATIMTPVKTKTILSGVSAFVLGAKSNVEKNFYQEVSFFILNTRMMAERKKVFSRILANSVLPVERYGVAQVLTDLDDYYVAGTVMNSFAVNYESASKEEQAAQLTVEKWTDMQKRIRDEVEAAMKAKTDVAK